MMTKKDFDTIAKTLHDNKPDSCDLEAMDQWNSTVHAFMGLLPKNYTGQDCRMFLAKCGMDH
jgi:hypothetical protein